MSFLTLAKGCAACRVCEGAAYQTPPVLYAGHHEAPIIAIGQNPGEIKSTDKPRNEWMDIFTHLGDETTHQIMPAWYMWDFYGSPGHSRLSKVFGTDWLLKGEMTWSNAVRCRTPGNSSPSADMINACKTWTDRLLAEKKAIIMVGSIAKSQVMDGEAHKLEWGAPKKHPRLGYVLAIKHYSAWSGNDEKIYKEAVKRIKEKI